MADPAPDKAVATNIQHWRDLVEAVAREGRRIGGFGQLTMVIDIHQGLPQRARCIHYETSYDLGRQAAPLTGATPRDIMQQRTK